MHILTALKTLEKESVERGIPIVGSIKGAWLLKQIQKHKPKKILELGTANGYSGCILASEGAEVTTIEINPDMAEEAKDTFEEFGMKVKVIVGDGVKNVKEMAEAVSKKKMVQAKKISSAESFAFDLIFIDFAKHLYHAVLDDSLKLLKKRGLLIADNIQMRGCADFKAAILKDERLKTEIINVGDGMSLSVKRR